MTDSKALRANNFDLLRIFAMFMVVVSHYIYHGIKGQDSLAVYYQFDSFMGGFNWFTMESLYVISCVAVNCFVMISGYFLIDKLNLRWKGILKIWLQAFFYCLVFLMIMLLTGENVGIKDVMKELFPVYGARYWFLTTYMGLMFVAPFLSRVAISLEKRQYAIMLLILFVISFGFLYGKIYAGFDTILWFSFLYLVAGYIKLFGVPVWSVKHKGKILLACWGTLVVMALGISMIHGGGIL